MTATPEESAEDRARRRELFRVPIQRPRPGHAPVLDRTLLVVVARAIREASTDD